MEIVQDSRGRPKGFAYVEFDSFDSIAPALRLNGRSVNGAPITVRESAAQKNRNVARLAEARRRAGSAALPGGSKLFVGSLLFSVTEDMVRKLFEPFGEVGLFLRSNASFL